jgi:hypothetical protein
LGITRIALAMTIVPLTPHRFSLIVETRLQGRWCRQFRHFRHFLHFLHFLHFDDLGERRWAFFGGAISRSGNSGPLAANERIWISKDRWTLQ